ncbi:hypothetical protein GCM10011505_50560 [Tistrella bauzanensis]|uniref:Uncharacterized protein n=1 Tax=Tistrella bauzanensis TaxID=657419 RepID=A0ABQ1JCH1_9PROT|nr:hypothetical protein GCM10011505_50560 [Tistrella bauzanensis]
MAVSITSPNIPSENHIFSAIDVEPFSGTTNKAARLISERVIRVDQARQVENPDSRLILEQIENFPLLAVVAEASHGQGSFDAPRFGACFWEVTTFDPVWQFQQSTPDKTELFGACCRMGLRNVSRSQ